MTKIIYPTLDLFIYQLRHGLGDTDEQVIENHQCFWENMPNQIKVNFENELDAENLEYAKLLELLDPSVKESLSIQNNSYIYHDDKQNLEGYYYPVRLYDTYGLIFDASINDRQSPQPTTSFKTLLKKAETKAGNLSQSWMASGYLSTGNKADPEALAKLLYKELANREWQNPQKGKFLGANLFEVWKSPHKWQDIKSENTHIVIILYPDLSTMDIAAEFYGDRLRLFCSRNKIIWEYACSQKLIRELEDEFKSILKKTKEINILYTSGQNYRLSQEQLNKLQEILGHSIITLSGYAEKISYLEILKSAIETNLKAYKKYLGKIEEKAQKKQGNNPNLGDTDLKCFEEFIQTAQQKYKIQVEQDHTSLSVGLKIAEDLINTIRGIIEIEQTKLDRITQDILNKKEENYKVRDAKLQNTIQAVGVGIGFGTGIAGIFSQTFPLIIEKKWALPSSKDPILPPHPFLISFFVSLVFGAVVGWGSWLLFKRHLDKKLYKQISSRSSLSGANFTTLPSSQNLD